jgi:hypothetical protein
MSTIEKRITMTTLSPYDQIEQALLVICFDAGFLPGLYFYPEDGGDMFLRNVGGLSTDYMALYPRREYSS